MIAYLEKEKLSLADWEIKAREKMAANQTTQVELFKKLLTSIYIYIKMDQGDIYVVSINICALK